MARSLGVEFPGALYHVTSRGNKQENIYLSDEDRFLFLEIFSEVVGGVIGFVIGFVIPIV